jgi:predicted Zn-dependent peptidase
MLAEAEATQGDWRRIQEDLPLRDRVTAADVQRVAGKYFSDRLRTVVTLYPENTRGEDAR